MANIAVLDHGIWDEMKGYTLLSSKGEVDWLPIKFNAQQLFSTMVMQDIDQMWVSPGAARVRLLQPGNFTIMFERPDDEQGRSFIHDDMGGWKFSTYGDEFVSSVHGYREGGNQAERKLRSVIWPEYSGWAWEPGIDGPIMLAALNRLQAALGVDLSSSPGVTGRKFIVRTLEGQRHAHWLGSVEADLTKLPMKQGVADLAWKHADIDLSRWPIDVQLYLHCIDKNSMYLSAAAGLPLGIGDPVHWSAEELWRCEHDLPQLNGAGLYRISVTPPEWTEATHAWRLLFDGQQGPDPLYGSAEKENRQEWVSTSLLKLLYDFGYGVKINQAWIWPNNKRILEVPAAQLWQIRQQLHEEAITSASPQANAAALAYDWLKEIATSMVGLFASTEVRDARYRRPDV